MYAPNYKPKILIIDGNHLFCRCIFQPNYRILSNSTGMPTGAIYGFFSSLLSLTNKLQAQSAVVVFDGGRSQRRMEVYPDYKKREIKEDVDPDTGMTHQEYFTHQMSWVTTLLSKLGIKVVRLDGREGDDVIFQVAQLLKKADCTIVSDDRDFLSLVSPTISIYRPMSGQYITLDNFQEFSGGVKSPLHYLYTKVILGDGSDNIPQVLPRFGEKSVLTLLENIPESELSPERIISEAKLSKSSRISKFALVSTATIYRNLDLIDISREEFSSNDILDIIRILKEIKTIDDSSSRKIMSIMEFNASNMQRIIDVATLYLNYPIQELVDQEYLRQRLFGNTTALLS